MRLPIHTPWRSVDADHRASSATGEHPTPGEVLTEIGMLLTIHLAAAFAIALTLRLFGIA
ncbi:MAG: hypothetical protein HYX38_03300 [Rhodospirillales bacterium]|nr:hypothetical protein [Rhodospirillales bacterium]